MRRYVRRLQASQEVEVELAEEREGEREEAEAKNEGGSLMDLKQLQDAVNHRWDLQTSNPCHHSADANHALVHMTKALGKVASALNDAEHEKRDLRPEEVEKYLADLVICAARFGHGVIDLDVACTARLAEKFPIP